MGQLLEDIINRHNFTSPQNYHTLSKDPTTLEKVLTFVRGLKNVQVKAKEFKLIKSGHLAIEVLIEDTQNNIKHKPKFKTKNANWDNWKQHLTPHLSNYVDNFPDVVTENEIEEQTNLLTNIIVTRVT